MKEEAMRSILETIIQFSRSQITENEDKFDIEEISKLFFWVIELFSYNLLEIMFSWLVSLVLVQSLTKWD